MIDFLIIEAKEEEPDLPSMSEPGRLLFRYRPIQNEEPEVEVLGYDGSAFWLNEGGFPDYWIRDNVTLELEGMYVMEGITGFGSRDYFGEYDEEWEFKIVRRASPEEEAGECLL